MLYSVDWSNTDANLAVYNGKKITDKMPKPKAGMIIATENIPIKYAKPYLDKDIKIFRCNTDVVAREREKRGLDKSHEIDARIIYDLYINFPCLFREYKYDPVFSRLNSLYSTFKGIQHLRVATNNRVYANGEEQVQKILDNLEKQERDILKIITESLEEMSIYTEFLSKIKGIGPATSAGLIAYVGDLERFSTFGHMCAYFGIHVKDGQAPRKQMGVLANWHQKGRSLMLGVIADSFIKQRTPLYREVYEKEKKKQLPICKLMFNGKLGYKITAERRARRKAVKTFLKDFYQAYKRLGRDNTVRITIPPKVKNKNLK